MFLSFASGNRLVANVSDVFSLGEIKAMAMAINASPAPKVFCTAGSLETFSSQFLLTWQDQSGKQYTLPLTPEISSRIQGPYNRRNVFGAVLSYGPVLEASPYMKPLYEAVLKYGMEEKGTLLSELGVDRSQINGKLLISVQPRPDAVAGDLNLTKEVHVR